MSVTGTTRDAAVTANTWPRVENTSDFEIESALQEETAPHPPASTALMTELLASALCAGIGG